MKRSSGRSAARPAWNLGRLFGQKAPLKLKVMWSIRVGLQLKGDSRPLALFDLAIDSKLRACGLVGLRVRDVAHGMHTGSRGCVIQRKTKRPVQFEITPQTRDALVAWLDSQKLGLDDLPAGVEVVQGDLLDVDALRQAFQGVSTLFLLNAVVADEFTQALITLNVAREAGVERVVYLSVIHSDRYVNVPHFAGKFGVECMIDAMGFNATVLRPAYFMDNDLTIKDVVLGYGVYPMPVGSKGLAMIDARDIGEIAAIELPSRDQAPDGCALTRLTLVGPDTLTGADIAVIWSDALGRPIAYGGDDTAGFEQDPRQFMPAWMAHDMRQMVERFLSDGMVPEAGDAARLTALLGRPLRSYRDFAAAA